MFTAKEPQEYGGTFIDSYGSRKFVRQRLDDVMDAVAQARFNEKKWVWIEDDNEGYVRGHILNESNDQVEIGYESGGVRYSNGSPPPNIYSADSLDSLC